MEIAIRNPLWLYMLTTNLNRKHTVQPSHPHTLCMDWGLGWDRPQRPQLEGRYVTILWLLWQGTTTVIYSLSVKLTEIWVQGEAVRKNLAYALCFTPGAASIPWLVVTSAISVPSPHAIFLLCLSPQGARLSVYPFFVCYKDSKQASSTSSKL